MENILLVLAALAGAGMVAVVAHKLGEAHARLELVRGQRRRDRLGR